MSNYAQHQYDAGIFVAKLVVAFALFVIGLAAGIYVQQHYRMEETSIPVANTLRNVKASATFYDAVILEDGFRAKAKIIRMEDINE